MADGDRTDQHIDRARRIAARVVERFDLEPPVPIEEILSEYADVSIELTPAGIDGICCRLTSTRPSVILSSRSPVRRRRFTGAHELGHLVLPGHVDIEACAVDLSHPSPRNHEREANAFASAVLVPERWMRRHAPSAVGVRQALAELNGAEVSAEAACLAVFRFLPRDTVIALLGESGVQLALTSPQSRLARGALDLDGLQLLSRQTTVRGEVNVAGRTVYWWDLSSQSAAVSAQIEGSTSKQVLARICSRLHSGDRSAAKKLYQSAMAVSSHAFSQHSWATADDLADVIRVRFVGRPNYAAFVADPEFPSFVALRARELGGDLELTPYDVDPTSRHRTKVPYHGRFSRQRRTSATQLRLGAHLQKPRCRRSSWETKLEVLRATRREPGEHRGQDR